MRGRGFTLIELVATLAIMGILAVFASAKANLFSGVADAGAAQSLASYLGEAQRLAISQRRPVFVVISSSSLRVCPNVACATPLSSIDGQPLTVSASSGTFSPAAVLTFDSAGRPSWTPSSAGPFVLSYGGASAHVEAETGLVW